MKKAAGPPMCKCMEGPVLWLFLWIFWRVTGERGVGFCYAL